MGSPEGAQIASDGWPFTGRADALAAGQAALAAGRGVLVMGDGGVGKSRLLAELIGPTDGWHRVSASRVGSATALGAWSHLLPPGWAGDPAGAGAWRAIADHLAGAGPIRLLVEDAQWLDAASAALLHHLVSTGQAHAAVSSRRDLLAPQPITALWKDGHLARIDLEPLGLEEVGALVEARLGAPVEPRSVERLHVRTGGNVLLVREVVDDAQRAGTLRLVHGAWVEQEVGRPSPRLVDLLADRVEDLDPQEREATEVLAVAAPVGAELLARALSAPLLQRLGDRSLVRIERVGLRRVATPADPLMAEVVAERMGASRRTEVLELLVDVFERSAALDDGEALRLADWRLELGLGLEPGAALAASDLARSRHDFVLAERLARAALASGGGLPATIRVGEALMAQRQRAAADAVLGAVADHLHDLDDVLRYRYATARAMALSTEMGRLDDAIGVLESTIPTMGDDRWRWELEAHLAFLLGDCGRLAAAAPIAEARLANVEVHAPSAITAFIPSALVRTTGGRCHDTLQLCEAMMPVALANLDSRPEAAGWVAAAQMLATYTDGDMVAAQALCELFEQLVVDDSDPTLRAGILMSLGLALSEQGRLDGAIRLLQQAAALHEVDDRRGYQAWTFAIAAKTHAQRGALAEAREALEAARRHVWPGGQAFAGDLEVADLWVGMLEGDRRRATAALDRALAWTGAEGMTTTELNIRHEAVRAGLPPGPHVAPMVQLVAGEQSRWGRACASHVAALVADDGAGLTSAGTAFSELGIHLQAAEAHTHAAVAHRRAGETGSAVRAKALADASLARCESAATPALRSGDQVEGLTVREAEVAALAATGKSNQVIAAELDISVRTAETHLQRAFAKLGVHRRVDLAGVLGPPP